jgi:hypothetical protein
LIVAEAATLAVEVVEAAVLAVAIRAAQAEALEADVVVNRSFKNRYLEGCPRSAFFFKNGPVL